MHPLGSDLPRIRCARVRSLVLGGVLLSVELDPIDHSVYRGVCRIFNSDTRSVRVVRIQLHREGCCKDSTAKALWGNLDDALSKIEALSKVEVVVYCRSKQGTGCNVAGQREAICKLLPAPNGQKSLYVNVICTNPVQT